MGGPTGVPQKPATTTKDILIDFLAGGTGLFFCSWVNQMFVCFASSSSSSFSCTYERTGFDSYLTRHSSRALFPKLQLHHLSVLNFSYKRKMSIRKSLKRRNTKDSVIVSFDVSKRKELFHSGVEIGLMCCVIFPR